jgi:hypothetical protein
MRCLTVPHAFSHPPHLEVQQLLTWRCNTMHIVVELMAALITAILLIVLIVASIPGND